MYFFFVDPDQIHRWHRRLMFRSYTAGIEMIIEILIFFAFVVAVGAAIVKAYEWRQDALYGPYIFPAFSHQNKRITQTAAASQVRENDDLNSRPTDGCAGV
jgi:hypothetical protein